MKLQSIRQQRARKAQRPERSLMWGDPRRKSRYSPPRQPAREQHRRHQQNGRAKAQVARHVRGGRKFDQGASRRH